MIRTFIFLLKFIKIVRSLMEGISRIKKKIVKKFEEHILQKCAEHFFEIIDSCERHFS